MNPLLSIIIPSARPHRFVAPLLDSIRQQTLKRENFEVLLVKNGSLLNSPLQAQDGYNYLQSLERNVNRARNVGASTASGSYLYFLDDDCLLPNPEHLETVLTFVLSRPDMDVFGGGYTASHLRGYFSRVYHTIQCQWFHESAEWKLLGGNSIYKRSIFDQGYRFDETIDFGGAETELNVRLYQNNFKFLKLDPVFSVTHKISLGPFTFFSKAYRQGYHSLKRVSSAKSTVASNSNWGRRLYNALFLLGRHDAELNLPLGVSLRADRTAFWFAFFSTLRAP